MKSDDKVIAIFISVMLIGAFAILMYLNYNNSKLQIEKQKTEQLKLQLEMKKNN